MFSLANNLGCHSWRFGGWDIFSLCDQKYPEDEFGVPGVTTLRSGIRGRGNR